MAGNSNSGNRTGLPRERDKPFTDALRLAINRASGDRKRLDNVASALVSKAESGDVQAIIAIADRLEGKPLQSVEVDQTIEHKYVRAPAKASDDEWKQTLLMRTASGKPSADHKAN